MPYVGADFPNSTIGETISYFFDFTNTLASGEFVVSASWTAAVASDSEVFDPSASSIVLGAASISNNPAGVASIVGQQFSGMVAGVKYLVTATAITNEANHIIPFSHFYTDTPV